MDALNQIDGGDFPRGGSGDSAVAALAPAMVVHEDVEMFGTAGDDATLNVDAVPAGKRKLKPTSERSSKKRAVGSSSALPAAESAPAHNIVPSLKFKNLVVGMSVLGAVKEVHDLEIVVSLPNNLTGSVAITEISRVITERVERVAGAAGETEDGDDSETDDDEKEDLPDLRLLFSAGQLLRCVVAELGEEKDAAGIQRKKVELTLAQVNAGLSIEDLTVGMTLQASIASHEDHGCLVDLLGLQGDLRGFVNTVDIRPALKADEDIESVLPLGSVRQFIVKSVSANKKMVALTLDDKKLAVAALKNDDALTMQKFQAGALVNATVTTVLPTGLWLKVDVFEGSVDWNHSVGGCASVKDLSSYRVGQKVAARVMWRYPSADDNMHVSGKHQLGFTLHPQLVAWTPIQLPASLAIGTILEDLVVENVENGLGLVVRLLDSAATTSISRGFVHISRIDDERTETLDAKPKLKVGSRHTARVVGFDYVDGILQLSMQPSVLNAKFFRYEDVKIGQVVDAVILKVDIAAGLLVVQLSEGIRAICTRYHLSDLPTVTKMEKRFRVGDKIKVRVLTCDPANRKVSVTHKKTMVASTLPIVDSLAKADELLRQSAATPVWSYGIVTAVRPFGCIVSFFGDARGLVHVSDLSNQFVTNPSESFTNGQLVKCRLVSVDTADSKLKLSLCAPKGKELARSAAAINAPMSVPLAIGHIFSTSATVIHVDKDKRMAVLRLTVDGQHVNGVIHLEHMSDHVAHNAALFAALHPNGQIDEPLAVIGADRDGIVLTMKPALVHTFAHPKTSAKFPASINDITVGDVVIGHVHHVEAKLGAFVNFANDVCGLVYKSNISDDFVTNAADFVCVGQTVLAVVSDVDREQQRVSLSLKASDLSSSQHIVNDYRRLAVQSYAKLAGQSSSSPADVSRFGIGATVEMTVQSIIQDVCTVGVVSEGTEALLTSKLQEPGFVPVIGAKLSVRIVDANVERGVIDVTNRVDLMAKPPKKVKKAPVPSSFTIVLVKEDYLVLTAPELASGFAFALTNDLNDMRKTFGRFALGQTVSGSLLPIAKKDHKVWVLLTASGPVSSNGKKGGSRSALIAPVDPAVQSMDDIKTGLVTKGLIRSIKNTQMNIILVRGDPSTSPPQPAVSGRVHISQLVDDIKEIPVEKRKMNAFAALGFTHGATIDVAVVGFHDAKTHRTLPISHLQSARTMVELSVRGSVLRGEDVTAPPSSLRDVHVGQVLNGFISELPSDNKALTWVSLGTQLTGRLNVLDMSDDPVVLTSLDKHFSVGMAVRCRVLSKNEEKGNVDLSLFSIENDAAPPTTGKPTVGRITAARVTKISPENGLTLQFSHGGHTKFGHVALVDIADSFETAPTEKFTTGMFVRCCIVASTSKHIDLSLRTSRLQPVNGVDVRDKELSSIDDLTPGQLIRGFVKNVAQGGLFISIGRNLVARVKIGELFDEFVKEWQDKFGEGQLVTGRVRIVDAESGHVELSLKPSAVDPDTFVKTADTGKLRMEHLEVGHVVTGTIARVEKYGVFVDMDNTQGFGKQRLLRGMCHRNELADEEVKNVASAFAVGDRVKAKVLAVETESKRINLGLKSSYFDETADVEMAQAGSAESSDDEDEELKVARSDDEDEDLDEASVSGADSTTDNESNAADIVDDQVADSDDMDLASNNESESEDSENLLDSAGESDLSSEEDEDKIDDEAAPITVANSDSPLEVSPGFQWGATDWNPVLEESSEEDAASVGSDDSDSDADNASADSPATKKKSKRAKAKAKRDEELAITQKESEALAEPMAPETASDFDRYLLATPNSSFLWIQYMAFYVNMVEIEKARQIAERALKVIHFREEKEKFNIWIALLNLENKYGSKDSVDAVLKRAVSYNEPKHVYLALAKIYEKTEKMNQAEELYHQHILTKFKQSSKVWVQCGLFHFFRGDLERARDVLKRSLVSLPKRKHVKTIVKFAQFEYKYGDVERGRTIFEGIMNNYPKRVDLWSVYLDMEMRTKEVTMVRRLFERIIHMKFSSKKSRFFFKRFLEFEKQHGDDAQVQHVIDKARAYVQSLTQETAPVGH